MPIRSINIRKILPVIILFSALSKIEAQTDTAVTRPKAEHERFLGVQLNELIRQFTVSDPTATARQNPYLLTYATNSKRTNWGLRFGLGLQVGTSTGMDNNLGLDTTSKIFSIQWRGGAAWSHSFTDKLVTGIGADIVLNYSKRQATQNNGGGFGFANEIKTETITYGLGPAATLRYQFTRRIALGTEASFYYLTGSQKANFNGSSDNSAHTISSGAFNLPVAIYFIVRV